MTLKSLAFFTMLSALVACYGDLPVPVEAEAEAEAEAEEASLAQDSEYFSDGGYVLPQSQVAVIRRIGFEEVDEDVAIGFDLDGAVSNEGEVASCGHGDFVDEEGRTGIDNQFAELWTAIEPIVGEQVEALLLNAINDGRFLMLIELSDVDDLTNDDDVTVSVIRGAAQPLVNSRGQLMSDQTYYVDPDYPISVVEGARIVDGTVQAGPLTFSIPIEIFDADFLVALEQGQLRFDILEDGSLQGVLGGKMNVQDALEKLYTTTAAAEAEVVTPFIIETADMDLEDGVCTYMSTAFSFEAAGAFLVRYPEDEAD